MNGNDRVAEFICELEWKAVPTETKARAKLCLLDALGAALAGTLTPTSRIAAKYASQTWRGDGATVFLHGRRAQAAGAAFANACAANALDIDDDAIFTRGHPGAQLIPAALAVAEEIDATGAELLAALVVGYEVAIRAGRCWHDHHQIYQSCGSWGSVACAALSARLLKLDHSQVKHALGIAEYHAPNAPMMRDIVHPAMVKHAIHWGAMNGVTSAQLAQRGFTGIPSILGFPEYDEWVSDIGQRYWMTEWVFFKEWCSCAWGHAVCLAALDLIHQHAVSVDDIQHIRARVFEEATLLTGGYPTTTEQAQFSVVWPLACLLLDGELGPDQVLEHRFGDSRVRQLVDKIELVIDPEIDELYRQAKEMDLRMHSRVEIALQDGRLLDSGIVERAADRYDQEALIAKFRWLVGHVLDADRVERLVQLVLDFDNLASVRQFTELL